LNAIIDRESPVVVCLATYGPRLQHAPIAIESIANGIVKPGRIILVVDDGDELAPELEELGNRGLEIWRCESRFGPHKKWYPFTQKYPDFSGIFITADDDVIYPPEWLSELLQYACPQLVVAHRAHRMLVNDGGLESYLEWTTASLSSGNKFFVTGVGGVAYPAAVLKEAAKYGEEFLISSPKADDVWLNRAIIRSRVPIVLLRTSKWHNMIPGSQKVSLWSDNRTENDIQIAATFSESDIKTLQTGMLKDILIDNSIEKNLRNEISKLKAGMSNLKAVLANRETQISDIVNQARELDGYAKSLEDVVHERDATISKLSKELEAIKNSRAYRLVRFGR
jgi:hypothetical protein